MHTYVHYEFMMHTYILRTVTWEEVLLAMAHGFFPDIAGMLLAFTVVLVCRPRIEEVRWWWDSAVLGPGMHRICTVRTLLAAQSMYLRKYCTV